MREIRAQLTESGDGMIRGYAAVFNSWSKPISERGRVFREQIKPGALKPDGNVSLWWMHDQTDPLANTKSGTLTVTEDERGLAFVADIGNTQRANEIRDLVKRGVVSEMSIGFVVNQDTWDGTTSRTITSARLHEVSLVENAAYNGTIAAVRKETTMPLKEDRARVVELKNEYPSATEERQLAILEEIGDAEERIASEKAVLEARIKAPAVITSANRVASAAKDETREWFRGGFRSNRAIGINISGGSSNLTTNATMPILSNEFIKALDQESVMRTLATVETRGADTDVAIIANRISAALVGEGVAYGSSDMTATKVSFKAYKSGVYTDVSEEALQDTVWDLASQVVQEHARAHGRLWEGYYATGTGTSQPKGVTVATWTTSTTSTTSLTLPTVDDLVTAAYKLNPAYQANASWLMNQATWANIVKSSASGTAKYVLNGENANILRDGAVALFLGRPVYLSEFMSAAATANNPVVLFGDFKRAYRIVDRASVTFTVDDLSQASSGLVRYSSRMRSDGNAVDLSAATVVKVKA